MAAQKREKDETDLKVPENFYPLPKPDPPTLLDHPIRNKVPNADESRSSSVVKMIPDLPAAAQPSTSHDQLKKRREINRCSGCSRKVGLTGFRCRCGDMFCRDHRYSDRHDCSFDYKAAGREAIVRQNPLVRASKILKL
ncbi:zinc finger A20 and AN1 domain-containing stress-associated protein 11-like [Impatiens glandulifera]|uniref:zinc finger A20 and AN1 domain-containing stress-associated protein 11-like n=1 Tax=Impatiens glandulifera TaxID=253017 RepID=UPI001FB13355|nr:zinc finger A20 and AN1 domain-containing stress-associated protein 11-like [Impatiens glandulifera]